jgi:hypothetical protein
MARSNKGKQAAPIQSEPVDAQDRKARHLPMFGPDLTISIPLHLLPAYMRLYSLRPMTRKEIHDLAERMVIKPDGVLWVRREQGTNHEQEKDR